MDSSLNKSEQIIETDSYVNSNLNLFINILNSLESVSLEAKSFLKEKMSSDGKIDNQLLVLGNFDRESKKESFISGIIMFVIILGMYAIFHFTLDVELMREEIGSTGLLDLRLYIVGMIFWISTNSLIEELVFRQFIGDRLLELTGKKNLTVFLSALIFTSHHTVILSYYFSPLQNAVASLGIFLAGATWSILWLRHRSLMVCWISHAIADIAVFGLGYLILF